MTGVVGASRHELSQALSAALLPRERVLWTGTPDVNRIFSRQDFLLVPFSLLWGGFAIFWELLALGVFGDATANGDEAFSLFFVLWGIPFVIMGLYMIVGRFFLKRWVRRRTIYAVTDQRVLVVRHAFGTRVDSGFITSLPNVRASSDSTGRGSLDFQSPRESGWRWTGEPDAWGVGLSGLVFHDVEDPAGAMAAIDSVRRQEGNS